MAGSYNRVLLMGNLTRDPELRHLPNSNTAVCNIGLAINRRYRTADGEQREEVTFVDCEAFGKTAELISQYMRKGRPLFVEGHLRLDSWEKDGKKQSKLKVIIDAFQFIDSKPGSGGGGGDDEGGGATRGGGAPGAQGGGAQGGAGGGGYGARQAPRGPASYEPVSEEDIPF